MPKLTEFINTYILKKRFNANASKLTFWDNRGSLDLYYELQNHALQPSDTIQTLVYNYLNNITELPKCYCGNTITQFKSYKDGYNSFCSLSCLQKSPTTRKKREETMMSRHGKKCNLEGDTSHYMLDKYGIPNAQNLPDTLSKSKSTKLKRYGDENYTNPDKAKKTRLQNGNTHNIITKRVISEWNKTHDVDYMHRARETFKNISGVDNPSQLESVQIKKKQKSIDRYGRAFQALHLTTDATIMIDNPEYLRLKSVREIIKETGYSQSHISKYLKKHNITDEFRSSGEKDIVTFIRSFYNGDIIINSRSVIKPLEIDVYLPEYNFCIEYNGSYWHSDEYKSTHKTKHHLCNDKGLYLLQIFDFQWFDDRTRSILKSIIMYKCGIVNRVYARKCDIRPVPSSECNMFLYDNHLEGKCNSSTKIGLYNKDELLCLMAFGKSRFKKGEYELIRFCSKKGASVIGGASRLLKHFIKSFNGDKLISYSDNLYSNGGIYKLLGFNYLKETQGFFYVDKYNYNKVNRVKLQKHKLEDMGFSFNSDLTGKEIVKMNGYYLIYDAGQSKWEYRDNNGNNTNNKNTI